ncbi:M16 family metallopeptidase [Sphingosinicella rhizophila]|uniref:Insulinase family protein n=1 Tax=Sphingosinicella rhizophila TaxID=3050082 RepID=A0ABU3Q7G8_9SPHN|nr:insulinase family protein [Sphingosinicella sp. GR2756]MDT9599348.1 insulinase family protein [Sphingosinicella sp. GR2756]
MIKLLRVCGLVLFLAACPHFVERPAHAATAKAAWAHQASDLPADPDIRFGQLANGMRYAIMKNATPPGEASLRLRIDVGSLHERDDQQGVAHFLEHMVMNGTRNVPEGEFVHRLERAGLKFGPDTNASTDFQQTVYRLELPETDAKTIDTALFLLREIADQANLDPAAIERERGVILAEERKRATPQYRMAVDEFDFLLKGDILPRRLPIGDPDIIRTVPRQRLVDFYEAYYRPERTTLIAVGDFDVDQMEAKIRKQYQSWKGQGPAGTDVAPALLPDRTLEARLFVTSGVAPRIGLTWVKPADTSPDTRADRERRLIERLALQIINRRLERLAGRPKSPPFIAASISKGRYADRGETVALLAVTEEGKWQPALAALEQEQRRILRYGFTREELDREIAELRAQLTSAAAGAATRFSSGLAQALVGAVNQNEVFTSPATILTLFDRVVEGLEAQKVSESARNLFGSDGPLLYLSSSIASGAREQDLIEIYSRSRRLVSVGPPKRQRFRPWPYTDFGPAGAVAERREIEGLGATAMEFENGVRLTFKQTAFRDDQILVAVRFGHGRMELPADRASPIWPLTSGGFISGGLAKLTFEQLQEALASKVYGADVGVDEDAFLIAGRTRPEDMATQMQVLAAYVAEPGWRQGGWNRLRAFGGNLVDRMDSTPSGVFNRDVNAMLRSGDRRWETPTRAEMEAATVADAKAFLEPGLRSGPIEVVIVGDIDLDEAIRQTAATFGALPFRLAETAPRDERTPRFPEGKLERRTHKGRSDQGLAFIAWPTNDFFSDQKRTRAVNLLAQVMQLRLREEIREKQGATYSANAGHAPSEAFTGYGYISARIDAPPAHLDDFFRDVRAIAGDLRNKPVSADELQRARQPLIENIQRQKAGNAWWLARLGGVQDHPERVESIRRSIEQYLSLTPADLQRAAQTYLIDAKAWRMIVTPEKETGDSGSSR